MTQPLRLICVDLSAPPLFDKADPDGTRRGYEPSAAETIAAKLGRPVEWVVTSWGDMIPAVNDGRGDAIWCGQGITDERAALVDFTDPYAVFDESLLVRADTEITTAADLAGRRVGAIAGSTNMALAETFPGVVPVAFEGTDDVFGDMIAALRAGTIDGLVDDDVALVPVGDEPDLKIAFTIATRNRWGVAVAKGNHGLREEINAAMRASVADGSLERAWTQWMPNLTFPLHADSADTTQ
ncbi:MULTISPECIES: substrate-binding periplasmic protein [Mycolicibacterium]|uniref:ABC transporter glutamine-binding protein GlnH n=1 Tax=Mycolicibacterium chlorophenolicum TaxID=37916 RepID=A0A0J6WBS0_9MYCO|nr:ABC transporter substrate-binding protein [Mycolicibacterium chlorophenolicum]KMO79142.1 ABC transporter glutamine-binding protein GlnH precursor [Mycolicibacterium chlorophenolicum]